MKSTFEYVKPSTAAEAVTYLSRYGTAAHIWAGGTDMTLHWQHEKVSPEVCVDVRDLSELDYIRVENNAIRIGAMTALATLERSAEEHHILAMLSDITKLMCTPQTRTLATVGGNQCNASPAADLSPAFVALDATAVIFGALGTREVAMVDFFEGVNKTAVGQAELLQEIVIPLPADGNIQGSYHRIDRTVVDIALVNASASITVGLDGKISKVGIGLGAVAPVILSPTDSEAMLVGTVLADVTKDQLEAVAAAAVTIARPITDIRATAEYRRDMLKVMVRRSLEDSIVKHGGAIA